MQFFIELNWIAISQIILMDIFLGGDNAIVIALACRNLPHKLRIQGILWGTFGAIVMRIVLIVFAVNLLKIAYIKLVSGVLLFWIAIKLLYDNHHCNAVNASKKLWIAVKTIIIADFVMSLDNVIAVASTANQASKHQFFLVCVGTLISISIVIWGSTLVLKIIARVPFLLKVCAAFLGYLAGNMIISDVAANAYLQNYTVYRYILEISLPLNLNFLSLISACFVMCIGICMSYNRTFLNIKCIKIKK